MPLQVQYVPPPEALRELPVPAPPRIVRKKGGFPLAAVALILGALLLAGGVVIVVLWKGAPPISGQPRATPDGKDVLHLVCEPKSCKDGTVVTLGGAKATFAAGEADLSLATPLHVGDNQLELMVDRPGMGRDEMVKLIVPVAFRVSADVTTMSAPKPGITIRVQAQKGADVRVDDKPLALDANGAAAYAIDETAATEGAADVSRVVSVDVPYVIVLPATAAKKSPTPPAPQKGTVSARVAVAPLRVDAPGERAVVEEDKVLVAGRAAKGSTVTVDGAAVTVAPDGAFETFVPLPALGDRTIDVRGGTGELMPRTVHLSVTRVTTLVDAAKAYEQQKPIGYDAAMSDLVGKTGSPIVVDGTVLESRPAGHRTYVLVDDRRGCARGPCLARVVVGRDLPIVRGDSLKAYGIVARAFAASTGQTVPEVEAAFVLRAKR
jgi:RNase P/RNase MRP subunit p29